MSRFPISLDDVRAAADGLMGATSQTPLVASDDDVRKALRFVFDHYKLMAEPGAVVGIAAVLNGRINITGKTIATVITGGNIDRQRFCDLTAMNDR